jgi:hypothetical protein
MVAKSVIAMNQEGIGLVALFQAIIISAMPLATYTAACYGRLSVGSLVTADFSQYFRLFRSLRFVGQITFVWSSRYIFKLVQILA